MKVPRGFGTLAARTGDATLLDFWQIAHPTPTSSALGSLATLHRPMNRSRTCAAACAVTPATAVRTAKRMPGGRKDTTASTRKRKNFAVGLSHARTRLPDSLTGSAQFSTTSDT